MSREILCKFMDSGFQVMISSWDWLKANDLPNYIAIILWPVALFLWNQREVGNVPNLKVSLSKGKTTINGQDREAINLIFLNNTGAVVYLTEVRILNCSKNFQVDPLASRDIAESSHEIKFARSQESGALIERQVILQTNGEAGSCLALKSSPDEEMLAYRPCALRKIFRCPKYFLLKYTAMVGNNRYKVSMVY